VHSLDCGGIGPYELAYSDFDAEAGGEALDALEAGAQSEGLAQFASCSLGVAYLEEGFGESLADLRPVLVGQAELEGVAEMLDGLPRPGLSRHVLAIEADDPFLDFLEEIAEAWALELLPVDLLVEDQCFVHLALSLVLLPEQKLAVEVVLEGQVGIEVEGGAAAAETFIGLDGAVAVAVEEVLKDAAALSPHTVSGLDGRDDGAIAAGPQGLEAELMVVELAAALVGKDVVGLDDLAGPLFGPRNVTPVAVGVEALEQLAERTLDVRKYCAALYLEDLVVVDHRVVSRGCPRGRRTAS